MKIAIYQIEATRDMEGVLFMGLDAHKKVMGSANIDASIYTKVFEGNVKAKDLEDVLTEVPLNGVKGFECIPAAIHTDSEKRLFVIDRPNIANNIDYRLPVGVSVFANAIDALRGVDCVYDCYINEFENGPMILAVKMAATSYETGKPTFDSRDRRFFLLPEDASQGDIIEPISPPLRTDKLNLGLQDQLNMLSSKCGFGETYYRFNGGSVATATQVISENSTMFRTIKKHGVS